MSSYLVTFVDEAHNPVPVEADGYVEDSDTKTYRFTDEHGVKASFLMPAVLSVERTTTPADSSAG